MDNIGRFDGLSPLSRQFLNRATDNMTAQMNTVKRQDEAAPEKEAHERDLSDLAYLDASTVTASEGFEASSYSGELGEAADDLIEDDSERLEENQRHLGHEQAEEAKHKGYTAVNAETGVETGRERDNGRRATDERLAQLRMDVPDEIWTASASMIEGQMVGETPKAGLLQLKSIPEPGLLEMEHAEYAMEPMEITDRQTGPLPAMVEA
jgi:hypothetical protein